MAEQENVADRARFPVWFEDETGGGCEALRIDLDEQGDVYYLLTDEDANLPVVGDKAFLGLYLGDSGDPLFMREIEEFVAPQFVDLRPTTREYAEILKALGAKCGFDGADLTENTTVERYEHDGGFAVAVSYGNARQWLYVSCPKCGHDWSLDKLGVPGALRRDLSQTAVEPEAPECGFCGCTLSLNDTGRPIAHDHRDDSPESLPTMRGMNAYGNPNYENRGMF